MPAGRRENKSRIKKEKILQTTLQLILKKGSISATSTTDICRSARVARPSLYHYFGSKRNLILSAHTYLMGKNFKPYLEKAALIDEPYQRLIYMVETYTREIVCLYPELRVLIHDALIINDRYFREVRKEWKRHYLLLRDTIIQLQSQGRIGKELKPSWAALFVLGMLTWVTYWFDYSKGKNIRGITDTALQMVLQALGLKDARLSKNKNATDGTDYTDSDGTNTRPRIF